MHQFKYGISCSLEPQPVRQPTIIRGEIEHVAKEVKRAGYDAIELFIREPKQYSAARLKKAASDCGLEFCAISTGMEYNLNHLCLISDDLAVRRGAIDRLKEHLDLGAGIGSPVVVGIMRGNIADFSHYQEYEDRLSDALYVLSEYAKTAGTQIYVESIMRYINNYLNSAPDTAAYLRKLKLPNVKLHIDTHSMNVEDRDMAQSILEVADITGYVHFSDSDRRYPGAGNVDFKAALSALMDSGYQGYISTECVPWPDEFTCAQRGLDYIKALEQVLTIENYTKKGV